VLLVLVFAAGTAAAAEDARSDSRLDGAVVRAASARALPARATLDLPPHVPLPGCGTPPDEAQVCSGPAALVDAPARPAARVPRGSALARPPPAAPPLPEPRAGAARAPSHT
jgi:hypothetical protein